MIGRLVTNPSVIALAGLAVLSVLVIQWALGVSVSDHGISWSGEPSDEQLWQMRLNRIAGSAPAIAVSVGITSVLGILAIASASRRRSPSA